MRARAWSTLLAAALVAASAGCRFGAAVEATPIVGAAPQTVAVWPFAAGAEPPGDDLWFHGLAYHLGRRGYRVVAPGVAREVLASSDLASGLRDEAAVGRALLADAVLYVEVRGFDASGGRALKEASWDIVWRLVSTRGEGQQWSYANRGSWRQADRAPLESFRSFDEQQEPPPILPIGGSDVPAFRDTRDVMAHLHRVAMARLPERARP